MAELESQQLYNHEITRKVKKNDKRFKELAEAAESEKTCKLKLENTIEDLNMKIKSLRHQLEETEQASADNLARFRKVQLEIDGYRTKAELVESQLSSMRLRSRMSAQVGNEALCKLSLFFLNVSNYNDIEGFR